MAKKKIKDLGKLPDRSITINELLDISEIIDDIETLLKHKTEINEYIFIYTLHNDDSGLHYMVRGLLSRIIYLIEEYKQELLNPSNK
jgi:hypothetical protein